MAVRKARKRVVFAKLESTYGTNPTLAVTDAILTRNLVLDDSYAGDKVSRNLDRPTLGLEEEINVGPYQMLSFEVELAGSGTAGVAPRYGRLLQACGFTETVDPSTGGPDYVEYEENEVLDKSVYMSFELDGQQHLIPGARGSASFNWQKGIPFIKFTFWGLYTRPTIASVGTPNWSGIPSPVPVTNANTTLAIDAFEPVAQSLTCDTSMQLVMRNCINQEEVLLTDRAPTGQIVINAPVLTDINLWEDFLESHVTVSTGAVELTHGITEGNIVDFENPTVQLSSIQEGDDTGIAIYTLNARYIGTSKLTVR